MGGVEQGENGGDRETAVVGKQQETSGYQCITKYETKSRFQAFLHHFRKFSAEFHV